MGDSTLGKSDTSIRVPTLGESEVHNENRSDHPQPHPDSSMSRSQPVALKGADGQKSLLLRGVHYRLVLAAPRF